MWGLKKQNTVFAIGKSIFNLTSAVDIGSLALEYGGGGHARVGAISLAPGHLDEARTIAAEIVSELKT